MENLPPSTHSAEVRAREALPVWRSIVLRLVFFYFALTLVVVVVSLTLLRSSQRMQIQEKFGITRQAIAASTAPYVDAEALAAIRTNADAKRPEFAAVRKVLERARAQNGLMAEEVYIVRPGDEPHSFPFVVMLQERTFIGDAYHPPPQVLAAYQDVLSTGKPARTSLFVDAHGTFISGLAPIVDKNGVPVAILHADASVDEYLAEEQMVLNKLAIAALIILLTILVLGIAAYRFMRRRVQALLRGTHAILDGNYEHRVQMPGSNELVQIGDTLDHAMEKLKERFEMLKFLPKHTAVMIEDRARKGGVSLDVARRVDVVVFESDIRGFTTLSEQLEPEGVIMMLNTYVRLQAELIEAAGGSIDKYMGDAVLAIFDGELAHRRALDCAKEIQAEVARRNEDPQFGREVHIGIGIASGEVVMGNMGSENRMEHTVIGSTVNLAARLCSAALAGEIVVTRVAHHTANPECDVAFEVTEAIAAKGFADPIECLRLARGETGWANAPSEA